MINHSADDAVGLHIVDRGAQEYTQTMHDDVLQVVCMWLQQLNTEQSWNDDEVENMQLGLRVNFSGTRECD